MKKFMLFIGIAMLALTLSALALADESEDTSSDASPETPSLTLEDLRIDPQEPDPLNDPNPIQDRIHRKQQEQKRERSQAEREIDKIPESVAVTPTIEEGGVGVKITIPTE